MSTAPGARDDSWTVAINETITYWRRFTRADLAHLLGTDLDDATDTEVIDQVTGSPAVEEALQHYGSVEAGEWSVSPTDRPPRADTAVSDESSRNDAGTPEAVARATHDHATTQVLGRDLTSPQVLLGDSGGLSAVSEVSASSAMPGLMCVETEHGPLYLDPDHLYTVLEEA